MKNNKIIDIQEILFNEMKRLNDEKYMNENGMAEISRSNALTNNALTYIKAINAQLRILETAEKNQQTSQSLIQELGIK